MTSRRLARGLKTVMCVAVALAFTASCDAFKAKESKHKRKDRAAPQDEGDEKAHEGKKAKAEEKGHGRKAGEASGHGAVTMRPRDWSRFPAIVERTTDADVVGLGDVHGGFDRLVALLSGAHLIRSTGAGYAWTGGRTVLVSVGDLINKGDQSVPVLDLMMALQSQAPSSGGEVIVTLGNHEAEFFADPRNKKAKKEFDAELRGKRIDPETVAAGAPPYGDWLANRPLAARVNSWFFCHAGNTSGIVTAELGRQFQAAVDGGHWDSSFLIGDNSILEAQKWWKKGNLDANLAGVQAHHIVFGHDPGAFDQPGRIAQQMRGKLFLIDVGMSPAVDYSKGALLQIHRAAGAEEVSSIDPSGRKTPVWKGAP